MGWCAGAGTHATLLLRQLLRASPESLRSQAMLVDDSKWAMITASVLAAMAALTGVVWEIVVAGPRAGFSMPLGLTTIVLSWAFLHVLFAYHYAHAYWVAGGGFEFPGGDRPDGLEFLYLAFTVGMTGAVSDVSTSSPAMRRLVLTHGLAAFAFNAAIVGAAVNLLA